MARIGLGGLAVLAYAADPASAAAVFDRLAAAFAAAEPRFCGRCWQPEAAVAHAMRAEHPVILADPQDNAGGGSSDTPALLAALIAARTEGALLALLCDGDAAAAADCGGRGGDPGEPPTRRPSWASRRQPVRG